jgi:hypothetical protein
LSNGLAGPVEAGARVAAKAGQYHLAALNIQTDDSATAQAASGLETNAAYGAAMNL